MTAIVFDTETTGLIKSLAQPLDKQPRIIELYAVKVDAKWKKVDDLHLLIHPELKLSEEIIKITGINDSMLKGKPLFAKVAPQIEKFFSDANKIIAHNLTFDTDMLDLEWKRYGQTMPRKPQSDFARFPFKREQALICTVEATEWLLGRRMKLQELHVHLFKKEFEGAHRAKSDVEALLACCKELAKRNAL